MRWEAIIGFFVALSALGCSCSEDTETAGPAVGGGGGAGGGGGSGGGSGGAASCDAAGQVLCGSDCADLSSDPQHCGACSSACDAAEICCAGTCVESASCSFAVTSLDPKIGWLNGGDWVTVKGAGFQKGLRVWIGTGRAPVLMIDGTTARIQTPPGPLGKHAVKIELGSQTATLPEGFEYKSGGLKTPWKQIPMAAVRGEHPGVAVLQDGRALVTGGTTVPDDANTCQATAEIFVRSTESVGPAKNVMSTPRWFHSAVTLLDGRVLVVGGACNLFNPSICPGDSKLADLFDPKTDSFKPTGSTFNVARYWTNAVLLCDGRVLVRSANDPSLEAYDPATDAFSVVGQTGAAQTLGFMVRLRDGRVLMGGSHTQGPPEKAYLFDPDLGTVQEVGPLLQPRGWLTAHTLPDGRVLIVGGNAPATGTYAPLDTLEIFDPVTSGFSLAPYKLLLPRFGHASALVRDGTVLVIGGYVEPDACNPPADTDTVDQIDPVKGTVTAFATLPQARVESTAVTLLDGSVLHIAGGHCGTPVATPFLDFLPGDPKVQ